MKKTEHTYTLLQLAGFHVFEYGIVVPHNLS